MLASPPWDDVETLGWFGIACTPELRHLLQLATASPGEDKDLGRLCAEYSTQSVLPWRLVQRAHSALLVPSAAGDRSSAAAADSESAPPLLGVTLVLPSPPARERSAELVQRLAALQANLDARAYAQMVADVAPSDAGGPPRSGGGGGDGDTGAFFPTTRLQLSFGLHVLVTMGAFFAAGHYGGRWLLHSEAAAAVCGALGLAAGLLLETTLLILRANMPAPLDQRYSHLLGKSWENRAAAAAAATGSKSSTAAAQGPALATGGAAAGSGGGSAGGGGSASGDVGLSRRAAAGGKFTSGGVPISSSNAALRTQPGRAKLE